MGEYINEPWLGTAEYDQKVKTLGHGLWAVYCIKLNTFADVQPRAKVGMAVIQNLDCVPLAARGPFLNKEPFDGQPTNHTHHR